MPSAADSVEAFAECSRSFCELIESADELGRGALVWEAGESLARLYAAAHALPDGPVAGDLVDSEETANEEEGLRKRQWRLSAKFDDLDYYWLVYDPYDEEGLDLDEVARHLPAELLEKNRDVLESGRPKEESAAPKPVGSLLSHDLMDVYRGVKSGLALHERGERESAIWEWRFGFQNNWGSHAASALFAIHWLTHASGARWIARDDS